jgi:antitoxin HicB
MNLVAGLDCACYLLFNLHDRTLERYNRLSPISPRRIAIKRVLVRQLAEEMKLKKITKTEMATRMKTRRSQLDRLLDPEKTGVSIDTIQRAASVVSRQLHIELI